MCVSAVCVFVLVLQPSLASQASRCVFEGAVAAGQGNSCALRLHGQSSALALLLKNIMYSD